MITPFGEFGYHKYDRTHGYGSPASYQATYTYSHYGVGVLGQYSPVGRTVFSSYLFIGCNFDSDVVVVLAAPFTGFSAELGNSNLYKVGASIGYALTKNIHANLGVHVAGWINGASGNKPIGYGLYAYEPDSLTNITTAEAGIGLSF